MLVSSEDKLSGCTNGGSGSVCLFSTLLLGVSLVCVFICDTVSDNTYDDFRAKLGVVIGVVDCDTVPGKVKVDIVWEA